MVRIVVVDSGARGNALLYAYAHSLKESQQPFEGLVLGSLCASREDYVDLGNKEQVLDRILRYNPDLVDVAQDEALASGLVDTLRERGVKVFGPTKKASRIEWDKLWARDFMNRHQIPTPRYASFGHAQEAQAREYALRLIAEGKKIFFKAAGLCAGKGVVGASTKLEVEAAIRTMQERGAASQVYLIEEGIIGEEFSYFAIADGKSFHCFRSAQDNKRIYDGDNGPNTGGMGAHCPALITKGIDKRIIDTIIRPTFQGLAQEGTPYTGILYLGGIVTSSEEINVIEFNSRWGDPECLVVLPGIKTNYFELITKTIEGRLSEMHPEEDSLFRVAIVGASRGYPDAYEKGKRITFDSGKFPKQCWIVPAAVVERDGAQYTNGGRLFSVVAQGENLREAQKIALQGMSCFAVEGNGLHFRKDIGYRDLNRNKN